MARVMFTFCIIVMALPFVSPYCPGEHEELGCDEKRQDKDCREAYQYRQLESDTPSYPCSPKCYCVEGAVRDSAGVCIPLEQCPNPEDKCTESGMDQSWVHEGEESGCPFRSNNRLVVNTVSFDKECEIDRLTGYRDDSCYKCLCDVGFFRVKDGDCVQFCPGVGENDALDIECPENEEPSCDVQKIENDCRYLYQNRTLEPIPDLEYAECEEKCYCDYEHYRHADGSCVPKDQCSSPAQDCEPNEKFVLEGSEDTCQAGQADGNSESCDVDIVSGYRPASCYKCQCNSGYFRDVDGECVKTCTSK